MRPKGMFIATLAILAGSLSSCGGFQRQATPPSYPVIRVHIAPKAGLSALPVTIAQKLGFFAHEHIRVQWRPANESVVDIGPAGSSWPIAGYLSTRPDLILVSPTPDPAFRLHSLDHLPLAASPETAPDRNLAEKILAKHYAHLSHWSVMPTHVIEQLWSHHRLPWALVNLVQAQRLKTIDPSTVVLAWLGASTGPIPNWGIAVKQSNMPIVRFLSALNLALWYLHTTTPTTLAQELSNNRPNPPLAHLVGTAQRYQYWPLTTVPDAPTYNRRKTMWDTSWPPFSQGVDGKAAHQALSETGK